MSPKPVSLMQTDSRVQYAPPLHPGEPGYLLFIRGSSLLAQPFDADRLRLLASRFRSRRTSFTTVRTFRQTSRYPRMAFWFIRPDFPIRELNWYDRAGNEWARSAGRRNTGAMSACPATGAAWRRRSGVPENGATRHLDLRCQWERKPAAHVPPGNSSQAGVVARWNAPRGGKIRGRWPATRGSGPGRYGTPQEFMNRILKRARRLCPRTGLRTADSSRLTTASARSSMWRGSRTWPAAKSCPS